MARFRRRSKPKIRWAWTGFSGSFLLSTTGKTVVNIVAPATFSTVADIVVERTLLDFNFVYTNEEESTPVVHPPVLIAGVLTVVPTDADEDPVTEAVPDPQDGDVDTTQKRVMWTKWWSLPALTDQLSAATSMGTMSSWSFAVSSATGANQLSSFNGLMNGGNPYDIGVRRKLGGDEALVLSLSAATIEVDTAVQCDLYARALLRIGRK